MGGWACQRANPICAARGGTANLAGAVGAVGLARLNQGTAPPPSPRSAGSDEEALSLDGTASSGASDAGQVVPQRSVLDALLLGEWEDRAEVRSAAAAAAARAPLRGPQPRSGRSAPPLAQPPRRRAAT